MFDTRKSWNRTNSGEIDLNIRTHASSKDRQDDVSSVKIFVTYPLHMVWEADIPTDSAQ